MSNVFSSKRAYFLRKKHAPYDLRQKGRALKYKLYFSVFSVSEGSFVIRAVLQPQVHFCEVHLLAIGQPTHALPFFFCL